jgi:hypothetical protein
MAVSISSHRNGTTDPRGICKHPEQKRWGRLLDLYVKRLILQLTRTPSQ